jgi:phage terminase large subunit-like protein
LEPSSEMTTRGEKVCAFIERYCLIPEGSKVGQPIKLLDFQRKFVLDVYDNPAGTSRAYLSVARKNGKSALIAAIVLAHLVGPEAKQNSQIISGARSRDQASLVFKLAAKMRANCKTKWNTKPTVPTQ